MLRRNRSHCVGLYSFPSVLTQLPREGAIRSNTHSTQPYFRYTDGYSEPLPRQAAESPLRKRQHAQPRAGRPAVQEAPRAPHGRPGGVRPRPRSAAPSRTGRPGASRPAAGTQPTAPPRPRSRHSRPGARALRAGPARLPLASRWPPVGRSLSCRPPARPETPPRRQRPTRSVAHSEGNPGGAQREAARLGSARRGRIPRAQRRRREELRRPRQSAPWAGRGGTGLGPPGRYAERRPRAVPGTAPPECSAPPRLWKGRGCRGSRSLPCGAFLPWAPSSS